MNAGIVAIRRHGSLALALALLLIPQLSLQGQVPSITYISPTTGPNTGGFDLDIHGFNLDITGLQVQIVDAIFARGDPSFARGTCTILHAEPNFLKVRLPTPSVADLWDDRDVNFNFRGLTYPANAYHVDVTHAGGSSALDGANAIVFEDDHPRYDGSTSPGDQVANPASPNFAYLRRVLRRPRDLLPDSPAFIFPTFHDRRIFQVGPGTFIPESEDEDAFILFGHQDQWFTVEIYGLADSDDLPNPDPQLMVLDPTGQTISLQNDGQNAFGVGAPGFRDDIRTPFEVERGPVNRNSRWSFRATTNADYYVVVKSFGGEAGTYRVRARRDEHPERPQETMTYFDRLPTETLIAMPPSSPTTLVTTSALIDFNGDTDAYEMRVTTGTVYRIETNLLGQGLRDSTLALYNRNGRVSDTGAVSNLIKFNDDRSASDRSSLITTVSNVDAIFKVVVGGKNIDTDPFPLSYRLEIRAEKQPIVDAVSPTTADNRGLAGNSFLVSGSFLDTTTSAFLRDTVNTARTQELTLLDRPTSTTLHVAIPSREPPNLFEPRVWSLQVRGRLGISDAKSTASIKFFDDFLDSFDDASNLAAQRPQDLLTVEPTPVVTGAAIGYRGDRDFFRFGSRANTTYQAETIVGGQLTLPQSVLTVFSTTGSALVTGLNSVTFTSFATETKFLLVEGGSLTQTGSYQVRVRIRRTPVVTALAPSSGTNAGGQQLTFTGTNYSNTQSIAMIDSRRRTVANLAPIVVATDQLMRATIPPRAVGDRYVPGSYTFTITNSSESGSTPPGLTFTMVDDHPEDRSNLGAADALAAPAGPTPTTTTAEIGFPGDVDLFRFRAVADAIYLITTGLRGLGDSKLALLSSQGSLIASNDNFIEGTGASQIEYVVPPSRSNTDHILSVTGTGPTSVGTYTLTLTLDDHPGNPLSTIGRPQDLVPTNGSTANGTLQTTADVDCFLFNESEDTPYLIETVPSGNPGAVAETKLELLGTNGAVLATAISSAPGQACKITTVGDSNTVGTNFIRVSASGASATGDYGVRVSVAAIPIVTDVCLLPGPCPIAGSPVASNAGNFSITIVGVNVDNPTSVRFAELPGSEFSITSAGSGRITATLPARPPGQRFPPNVYHIQVTNGAGNVSPSTNRGVITLIDDHPETSAAITAADVLAVEGAPLAADIGFAGDVDFFRFTAQANIVYVVEALRSSPGDVGRMSIQVFNGASQLAAPNSFGGNSTFVSVRALQNGDLFLSLRAQTASQTGGYFVRVFKARRPAVTAVSPSRGLRDRVTAVTLTGSGFLGASQCLMAGTQLSTPDVSNDSSLATTVPAGIAPGNYDILVTNAVGVSNPGPAKFQVDDHPNGIAASGPDAIASPRDDLPINQPPVTATLETQNDRDVFAFQAIPAHTYTALTNLLSLSDTVLTVLAPDGSTVLAQQGALNASAGLFNSRVSFTAAQSGTHYARVETAGTGSGNYGLSISDPLSPDDHSNSAAQLNQLTDTLSDGVAALGSINYGGDVDYFAFTGTRGAIYDIETTLGSISDTVLTLFDQDGVTRLAENDDNPDNLTSRASKIIAFQPSASGTYYARVRHLTSDSDSFGTYTVKVTSRQGSLAVLAVRASQLSVSRGQTATLEVDIENTGRHRLTGLSAALDIRAGTTVRNSDYVLTADPANAAEFFPGQAVTLRYLARVSATATVGAVRIDARGSGLDDGAPVSDPSSFTTTSWTVQTPAAVTIANFTAPVQVSRGQSVVVTMNLDNAGQAAAAVDSVGLKFTGSGGVSRDSDYQVTPAPGNPPLLAPGIPSGSVSRSLRTPVRFLVTVKNTAVLEAVTINGFFRGRDANSGAALSRDTASTKSQWSVQTAAGLFIKSVTAPSAVSQDQTTQVVMNLQNPGQGSVTLSAAGLRFIDGLGNDLSADYTPTLATALPLSVPGLGRVSLLFNVIVTPNATRTTVLVDGAAAGRDDRTQAIVSLIRAEQPAEWTVQRAAGFSVDSLAVAPLAVSRGGTIVVTMAVRNTGEATAQITSSSVQFFAASGGASRTSEYRITAAPANGKSLAGGASTTLTFSVLAGARATVGTLRVSGSVTGRDVNTAKLVTAASAPNSEPFFRLANIFVSITSPRSTDLLFFDGAIPFAATARDDSGASFSGATFTWRSSVSGLFGGGDSFSATLPAATHGVTVTASAGSGITSSTAVTLLVRPAPAPVGLLAVDGVLSRAASGSPLAAGFEIELTNASRGTRASYVTTDSTGRFRARFISTSGAVAGAGDVVTAQVREPVGLQRPTQPASFTIVSRDLALGARIQNFAADDLVEQLLSLRQGLNLIGLPINPATTSGTSFSADDLMRLTQSGFVSRLGKDSRTGRGRFEAAIAGLAGGFALEGNQGYLVQSPSDQVLSLRGTAWPPETLIRRMNKGLNFVALPLGVPPGFDAKGLLDLTTDGTLVSRLQPQITGISAFEVYVRNGAAPFAIESGKGYLLSVNSAGDLILRNAP